MSNIITIPRLIDCHVHFREPGFPQKATMASEAKSARAGGVHTVCEMPNTNPPTTTVEAFRDKVERASAITDCDIRFFFGLTEKAHITELKTLFADHSDLAKRCCGVKLYLDHSTGNQKVEGGIVEEIFQICAELGIMLVAHCEDAEINEEAMRLALRRAQGDKATQDDMADVSLHSLVRPCASEEKAIKEALEFVRKYNTTFHVAHLSTSAGLQLVREAKAEGLPVTCEVTPHHLFLTVEDYGTLGTLVKMNPPIRTMHEQEALWQGIVDGTVDCISTDHAPHTLQEKTEAPTPLEAPSGVPGVETMLPLLLTVAAGQWPHPNSARPNISFSTEDIVRLCFTNPNRIFNLGKKSSDQITIDLDEEWEIRASELHSQCEWTPFEGWKVKGKITEA